MLDFLLFFYFTPLLVFFFFLFFLLLPLLFRGNSTPLKSQYTNNGIKLPLEAGLLSSHPGGMYLASEVCVLA
jgi:hypothetical protein